MRSISCAGHPKNVGQADQSRRHRRLVCSRACSWHSCFGFGFYFAQALLALLNFFFAGTIAGTIDDSFQTNSQLEFYSSDLATSGTGMTLLGSMVTKDTFHKVGVSFLFLNPFLKSRCSLLGAPRGSMMVFFLLDSLRAVCLMAASICGILTQLFGIDIRCRFFFRLKRFSFFLILGMLTARLWRASRPTRVVCWHWTFIPSSRTCLPRALRMAR